MAHAEATVRIEGAPITFDVRAAETFVQRFVRPGVYVTVVDLSTDHIDVTTLADQTPIHLRGGVHITARLHLVS